MQIIGENPITIAGEQTLGDAEALDSLVESYADPPDGPRPLVTDANPIAAEPDTAALFTSSTVISAGVGPVVFQLLPRDKHRCNVVVKYSAGGALLGSVLIGGDQARVQNRAGAYVLAPNEQLTIHDYTGPLFIGLTNVEPYDIVISVMGVTS